MIKPFMNGEEVLWNDKELQLKWVRPELPEIEMWVAGYGPKALAVAGRVGDGVIIQLADPEIIQWIMGTARAAAEEAGRDPAELKCIVCAPSMITDDIAEARERDALVPGDGLEPRQGPDRPLRDRRLGRPEGADRLRRGAEVLRLQRALPRRRQARRVRDRRDLRPLLGARHRRAGDGEAARARGDRRRPVLDLPDDPQPGGDARGLRRAHHPRVQGQCRHRRRGGGADRGLAQRRGRLGAAAGAVREGDGGALGADDRAASSPGRGSGSSTWRPGRARPGSGCCR